MSECDGTQIKSTRFILAKLLTVFQHSRVRAELNATADKGFRASSLSEQINMISFVKFCPLWSGSYL